MTNFDDILNDWMKRNLEYARRLTAGCKDAAKVFETDAEELVEDTEWKRADAEWKYADAEGRAQQERRERGELNEDLGDESSLARHGFVGEEL